MRKVSLAVLLVSFGVSVVFAQHTPPTPATIAQNIVNRYTKLLMLDSGQQTEALAIFTTEITAEETAQKDERTQRQALHAAVLADNTTTIASASAALGADTAAVTLAKATAEAAFYKILSPIQQTQYPLLGGFGAGGWGGGRGPHGPRS